MNYMNELLNGFADRIRERAAEHDEPHARPAPIDAWRTAWRAGWGRVLSVRELTALVSGLRLSEKQQLMCDLDEPRIRYGKVFNTASDMLAIFNPWTDYVLKRDFPLPPHKSPCRDLEPLCYAVYVGSGLASAEELCLAMPRYAMAVADSLKEHSKLPLAERCEAEISLHKLTITAPRETLQELLLPEIFRTLDARCNGEEEHEYGDRYAA